LGDRGISKIADTKREMEIKGNQVTRKSGGRKPGYLNIRETRKRNIKPDTPIS
jgi:hypothetical protein